MKTTRATVHHINLMITVLPFSVIALHLFSLQVVTANNENQCEYYTKVLIPYQIFSGLFRTQHLDARLLSTDCRQPQETLGT